MTDGRPCNFEDILSKLTGARQSGDGWSASCPAPGHKTPAGHLTLKDAGDKALVTCHPGPHTYQDICRALGFDSLSYSSNGKGVETKKQKTLVATFSYKHEKDKEAFQIRRFDLGNGSKTFEAWHKKDGRYVSGMGEYKHRPILYHLPEIPEWIAAKRRIYLPEGELKADYIISNGGAATTSPFGAGRKKWRPPLSETLCGAHVVILPDNDKPGYDFAQDKAASLYGKTASLKVLELPGLPEKGDIVDWFKAGNTFEQLEQLTGQCPDYELSPDTTLPEIIVTDRHLRDITSEALSALYQGNDPPHIFRRSGALTRIGIDEKGRPFIETLTEAALRGKLARAANFVRISDKDESHAITPPLDVTRDIESLGVWQFPPLAGITESPALRRDGTVLAQPGYDATTGLYYVPAPGLVVPPIPEAPTDDELKAASELVLEVLCDFSFDSEASRANGHGALFTVLRPAIEGPAPLPVIDKPQPGSGASLIADVISIIATGHLAATMGVPRSEEEWEKKLSSHLLAGRSLCVIDNIGGKLYSDTLSRYLTSTNVSIRPLGRSADIILANTMTFIATGNNVRLGGDMPRRCYWVRLDTGVARPWLREAKFKHPELREWVFANRGAILVAILTIARAWITAGRPIPEGLPMLGGFEGYCRTIGGVLAFMGVSGFLNNLFSMYDKMDADTPQWEGFLEAWREVIGETPVTVAELVKRLNESEDFAATLPDTLATRDGRDYSRRMGNAFAKRADVRLPNGLMLVKGPERKHAKTWVAVSYDSTNSPQISLNSELSELVDTPAHKGIKDIYSYSNGVEINSPNSPLASKQGELTHQDTLAELPDYPEDDKCSDCGELLC